MAGQRIVISGIDITGYVTEMDVSGNDIDAPGSGRDMNGDMKRGLVATKAKLEIKCRVLSDSEVLAIANAIGGETVLVSYLDPYMGQRSNVEFYCSERRSAVWSSDGSRTYWKGLAFNMIEV